MYANVIVTLKRNTDVDISIFTLMIQCKRNYEGEYEQIWIGANQFDESIRSGVLFLVFKNSRYWENKSSGYLPNEIKLSVGI